MSKQLIIDLDQYNNELKMQFANGVEKSRAEMQAIVSAILKKGPNSVTVQEGATPEMVAFIEMLKKVHAQLPEGALNDELHTEDNKGDQELSNEGTDQDNV